MRKLRILVLFYLASILCGCSPSTPQGATSATPSFSPRNVVTATSTPRLNLISSPTSNKLFVSPSPINTVVQAPFRTATSTPDGIALANPAVLPQTLLVLDPVQIRSPNDGSMVVSPIPLDIRLAPTIIGKLLRIELRSEDGTLLVRKTIDLKRIEDSGYQFVDQIDFEIPVSSQKGVLIIRVEQTAKLPLVINSADLTLLSSGTARITPPSWQPEVIDILQPSPGAEGKGGMITVSGKVSSGAPQALKVQLISQDGKVVGHRLAGVGGSPDDTLRPFTAQVPYQIVERTQSWVVVYIDDGPDGEITHLASMPIVLNP